MSVFLDKYDLTAGQLRTGQREIKEELEMLQEKKLDRIDFKEEMETRKYEFNVLKSKVEEARLQHLTVEGYIDRYLPLKVQTMIAEALGLVVAKKDKRKLDDFMRNKIIELKMDFVSEKAINLQKKLQKAVNDVLKKSKA